jgi:hypothetical protein
MVDEEVSPDHGAGMNVDRGQKTGEMIDEAGQEKQLPPEKPMRHPMKGKSDDARIKQDFPT